MSERLIGTAILLVLLAAGACGAGASDRSQLVPVARDVSTLDGPEALEHPEGLDLAELLRQSGRATRSASAITAVEVYESRDQRSTWTIRRARSGGEWELVRATRDGEHDPGAEAPSARPRYFARQENLHGREPVTDIRLVGEDTVDGIPVWVIWYQLRIIPIDEDPVRYRTEWIEKSSLLLLRQVQHFRDPNLATWEWTFDLFYPD